MQKFEKYVLLGYSGHGTVVAEAALLAGLNLIGYADSRENSKNLFKLKFLGDERSPFFDFWSIDTGFILGIGDNLARMRAAEQIRNMGYVCDSVVHPDSRVSKWSHIGQGTFIARGVCVNPAVTLGKDVILNTGCSIDHDCVISDGVHVAPNAVLAGDVYLGEGVFVGANAIIKEGTRIGDYAIIGAGTVVLCDVAPKQIMVGNPAKIIEK